MPKKCSGKYGSSTTRKCHSKYNPIEQCWAVLENYWNGAILDSIDAALNWASNMTWKGIKPLVNLVEGTYEKGVKVWAKELEQLQPFWQRSETLPKWDVIPFFFIRVTTNAGLASIRAWMSVMDLEIWYDGSTRASILF